MTENEKFYDMTAKAKPEKCDCLNICGDDPWLKDGRARPCKDWSRLHPSAAELHRRHLASLKVMFANLTSAERLGVIDGHCLACMGPAPCTCTRDD